MSQFISLQEAVAMTTLYRQEKENILATAYKGQNILARSETFDRAAIDVLLAKSGCAALRVYYGMSEDLKVHAILVPVDEENADILPELTVSLTDDDDDIVERGVRCPEDCPPPSPLNP